MKSLLAAGAALALSANSSLAQTPPNPAPTPTPAPAPPPKFNSGSPLDGIRNQAWALLEEMTDAYEQCDAERFERALDELERLRQQAKAAAFAATGSAEFSNVKPEEAQGLADAIRDMITPRRLVLSTLRRECAREHRPGKIGSILGPRRPSGTTGQTTPQPQSAEPAEDILDEIEQDERIERERQKAEREREKAERERQAQAPQQPATPAQGLSEEEQKALATKLEEAERAEKTVTDLESDNWGDQKVRADSAHRFKDWLQGNSGFSPDAVRRWVERIDRVLDKIPPEDRAGFGTPQGPVRSTTLPLKLPPLPPPPSPISMLTPDERRLLDLHNSVRAEFRSPPLVWDSQLAAQAAAYGPTLARYDRPVHAPRTGRETSRENLLQALRGTPVERMVGVWLAEQRNFVPGVFPQVSRTGNWADVGHFTQMVWPTTTRVGCAVQRGLGEFDWLICRYAPPGNRDGVPIGLPPPPPPP